MKNTFTNLKKVVYRTSGKLLMLLAAAGFGSAAQGQTYCESNHYFGCAYNSTAYRYAAIEEVTFVQGGNVLHSKAPDGCQDRTNNTRYGAYFNVMNQTPGFQLAYGSEFSIWMNGHNYCCYGDMNVGVWVDLNRDGDFQDAGEFLGNVKPPCAQNRTMSGTLPQAKEYKFSIPCGATGSGVSRIRLRSSASYTRAWTSGQSCEESTGNPYYGETEDFIVTLSNSKTVQAGFFMPDTAFVKTKVNMVNANQKGYTYHGWDIGDDGSVEYTTTDASHKFNTDGRYCVELRSDNCVGSDSTVKCVQIVTPTAPPVADFVASANKVEIFNQFTLTDLSTNGAIYWEWFMFDRTDSANTHIDIAAGGTDADQNPDVFTAKGVPGFPGEGTWSVGLISSNDIGSSQAQIKYDYIQIEKGCDVEMGPGTLTSIPGNVITCTAGSMISKSDGSGNYSANESGLDALIAPCGATSISFTMDQWDVKAGVNLKVYDGPDATGTPLHPNNGFDNNNSPLNTTLVAKSGAMYFLWSSGSATGKGFHGTWTSTIGTQAPPVASFDAPDTIYNAVFNTFTNTSKNAIGEVFYDWTIDGTTETNSKDMDWISFTNNTYNICLTVETCAGKNTSCKNIVVSPITSQTELDFEADNRRPKAGDEVEFTATADKANTFLWTFFPSNNVNFVGGTSENSQNPVVTFGAAGKYTVSLKGWNNLDATDSATSYNQVIKDQYIIVIDYCTPVIGVTTSSDVAISNVMLESSNGDTLINNMSTEEIGYTNFTEDIREAVLTFGGEYKVSLERQTNANNVNRKVWIDWNIDGEFADGEMVLNEGTTSNLMTSASFTVPDLKDAFEGTTRMRVGISYNNDPNVPCGATSGVNNANRIGEFEDYAIILANDNTMPYITLNGSDTVYVEVGSTYTDAGATAMDPTEGDISSRLDSTSDVDAGAAGIYYVSYCVEDASGNKAPCVTRVVYVVVDQTAPELTLKGNNPEYVDVITGTFTEPGWTATDKTDGNLETAVQVDGTVNTFMIGTYTLTYTVQDAQGNIATQTRDVIVRDQVFPTITNDEIKMANGRNVVEVQLQSVFVDRTVLADNYNNGTFGPLFSYTITPSTAQGDADVDTRTKGTTVVKYTVVDESGNQTELVIDYVVEDYIAPVININTLDTVYHTVNSPYTPVQASVSDNLYDNTQVSLTRTSNVNPFVLGLYTDTYTATDASGNVAVRNRWVRVLDDEAPKVGSKVGPIVKLGLFSNVKLSDYLKLTDNYDAPADLMNNLEVLFNDVNVYEEGVYAAVFSTMDNSGNVSDEYTLIVEVSRNYERISGIETVAGKDLLKVYPNPSKGLFNVSFDLASNENVSVAVYDMMGNQVAEVAEGQLQKGSYLVDMTGKAAGMYFVRMSVNNQVFNQKVIIE